MMAAMKRSLAHEPSAPEPKTAKSGGPFGNRPFPPGSARHEVVETKMPEFMTAMLEAARMWIIVVGCAAAGWALGFRDGLPQRSEGRHRRRYPQLRSVGNGAESRPLGKTTRFRSLRDSRGRVRGDAHRIDAADGLECGAHGASGEQRCRTNSAPSPIRMCCPRSSVHTVVNCQ